MIFVDTGAWYALFVPTDPDSAAAAAWLANNSQPLITTDYVLDELLTVLRRRKELQRAVAVGERLLSGAVARIEHVTPDDVKAAWEVFRTFHDKEWSFTDCVSLVVMQRLGVSSAFAFDHHFRQFGTVAVVP